MGFFKRLFSADYRAAVAAEAAGDLELAAERYALAGYHDAAARMHMARAERASSHAHEIEALRDALHWAPEDGDLRAPACKALGEALLARARAEGIATERDRERVREAARLLEEAGEHAAAGDAWESIGADADASRAYGAGGMVDKLELLLAKGTAEAERKRALRQAFANYELHMANGERDLAAAALKQCIASADDRGDYQRLLDQLESRLIHGGRIVLEPRRGARIIATARSTLLIGRDPLCDLPLRAGGVSRRHAEITVSDGGFTLRDAGSRNGTLIGGLPVKGEVPLTDTGQFALGDVYQIGYRSVADGKALRLEVERGLDQGSVLLATAEDGVRLPLRELADLPLVVWFEDGRPFVEADAGAGSIALNEQRAVLGRTQLISGDVVLAGGTEVKVA